MASCVCNLRRVLPASCTPLFDPRISQTFNFTRRGYVASSEDAGSGEEVTRGSPPGSGSVGQADKRAEKKKDSRPRSVWAPDPETGYYRPINEANEAQENALKNKK